MVDGKREQRRRHWFVGPGDQLLSCTNTLHSCSNRLKALHYNTLLRPSIDLAACLRIRVAAANINVDMVLLLMMMIIR